MVGCQAHQLSLFSASTDIESEYYLLPLTFRVPLNNPTNKTIESVLENGVRVISEHLTHTSSAAVSILVEAGPQNEPENKSGLAHLCEHSLFLGTPQRNSKVLAQDIDAAGGCFGAFTAPDYTCFYAHVMEDYVSYGFDLLGDILVASEFPESGVEREQEVICQEIRGYKDQPDHVALQLTKELLWPNHLLSRSVTGRESDVRDLSRDDVVDFISQNYTPDRIIVAAAGAVDHGSIVEQVQDAFWTLKKTDDKRPKRIELAPPTEPRGGCRAHYLPTTQVSFSIGLPSMKYNDPRRYAMFVLANLFGGGMSSRLYQQLRERNALVYSVQSNLLSYRDGGAMIISGTTSLKGLLPSIEITLNQLVGLLVDGLPVSEEELWKSKMQVRSQSRLASDMISNRVSSIVTQEFHFGHRISSDEIIAQIDAVTIEDLQSLAQTLFSESLAHLAIVVAGPIRSDDAAFSDLESLVDKYGGVGQ